ncbi:MAG: hypothetical protein VX899_11440 [Myxococcota bacterium]|nr:hypothetical protein [Myxococcota bacterium]
MTRIGPILQACVRIVQAHWQALLRPTLVLAGVVLVMGMLIGTAVILGVLSGADVLQGPGFWPVAAGLFFVGRIISAPFEIWWLRHLQAAMSGNDRALVQISGREFIESLLLEAIRAPVVTAGFLMCILPGLFLRPMLFLPESALARGHGLRESFQRAFDLMRTRFQDVVITDFLLVLSCAALQLIPVIGYLLILPALLLGRYVLYLDLSGEIPAEELAA